jgi:hypothetical protein
MKFFLAMGPVNDIVDLIHNILQVTGPEIRLVCARLSSHERDQLSEYAPHFAT